MTRSHLPLRCVRGGGLTVDDRPLFGALERRGRIDQPGLQRVCDCGSFRQPRLGLLLMIRKVRGGCRDLRRALLFGALSRSLGIGQSLCERLPVSHLPGELGLELRVTLRCLLGSSLPLGGGHRFSALECCGRVGQFALQHIGRGGCLRPPGIGLFLSFRKSRGRIADVGCVPLTGALKRLLGGTESRL